MNDIQSNQHVDCVVDPPLDVFVAILLDIFGVTCFLLLLILAVLRLHDFSLDGLVIVELFEDYPRDLLAGHRNVNFIQQQYLVLALHLAAPLLLRTFFLSFDELVSDCVKNCIAQGVQLLLLEAVRKGEHWV